MEGQGRQIGGLVLCLMGVIGVCVACGLPMWRETSFTGANVVTAQTVWDGLWMHCVVQATGQMQCKRQSSPITMTTDIQAGRALMLLSIVTGLLGFIITVLGGGVANCSGKQPDNFLPPQPPSSSKAKMALVGGILCIVSGILCLVSVSWSAGYTVLVYNDPLVVQALKREVGTSIYIGWASAVLLLLGGVLICFVCCPPKRSSYPSYHTYAPYTYSYDSQPSRFPSRTPTVRSSIVNQKNPHDEGRPYDHNIPSRATTVPREYYY